MGTSERQKKPSVTLSFNRLLPASVLSWQRSTFHVNEVFECLVEEEHEVLHKLNSAAS